MKVAGLVLAAALTASLGAQAEPLEDNWTELGLYVFATKVSGDLGVGPFQTDFDASFADIVENLDIGVLALAEHRRGRFSFIFDAAHLRIGNKGAFATQGAISVATKVEVSQTIVEGFVGYRVLQDRDLGGSGFSLDALAGARYVRINTDVDASVDGLGAGSRGALDRTVDFVDPVIGLRGRYYLDERWNLTLYADIGGFGVGSERTWQAVGLLSYNFEGGYRVYAGARYLSFEFEDDTRFGDLNLDSEYFGPVLGFAARF